MGSTLSGYSRRLVVQPWLVPGGRPPVRRYNHEQTQPACERGIKATKAATTNVPIREPSFCRGIQQTCNATRTGCRQTTGRAAAAAAAAAVRHYGRSGPGAFAVQTDELKSKIRPPAGADGNQPRRCMMNGRREAASATSARARPVDGPSAIAANKRCKLKQGSRYAGTAQRR
jgi:hypothetical protein